LNVFKMNIYLSCNYPDLFLKFQNHGNSLQAFSKRQAIIAQPHISCSGKENGPRCFNSAMPPKDGIGWRAENSSRSLQNYQILSFYWFMNCRCTSIISSTEYSVCEITALNTFSPFTATLHQKHSQLLEAGDLYATISLWMIISFQQTECKCKKSILTSPVAVKQTRRVLNVTPF